jgi:serine/threonine protein kinase
MSELRRITERYRLDKQVAASDTGGVFRATDLQSGATVAVKLIDSDGGESDEQRQRFLATAGVFQSLRHPSLPRVLDFGFTDAGSAFLVTELLHGSGFEEVAGSPPGRVLTLLIQVVDGLEAMGAHGISTRNLRAENLLVVPGDGGEQVKILGLGSAVLEPGAMPVLDGYPEDLRAFGLLACRMLRVQTDFRVGIPLEVAVELEDIEALRALLEAALHGDPERHYPSWAEVRQALRSALFGHTKAESTARTETFVTHPGVAAEGAAPIASTAPIEIPAEFDPGGTLLLSSSPWSAPRTSPAPRTDDLDSTMMVPDFEPRPGAGAPAPPAPPAAARRLRHLRHLRRRFPPRRRRPAPSRSHARSCRTSWRGPRHRRPSRSWRSCRSRPSTPRCHPLRRRSWCRSCRCSRRRRPNSEWIRSLVRRRCGWSPPRSAAAAGSC